MIRLDRTRSRTRESVVPMINVAFLLLIFFLMVAVIAPPQPFPVTPPEASGQADVPAPQILFVNKDGDLALGSHRGDAVFAAVTSSRIRLRADAGLNASELARILARLSETGATSIEIATLPR